MDVTGSNTKPTGSLGSIPWREMAAVGVDPGTSETAREIDVVGRGVLVAARMVVLFLLNAGTLIPDVILHKNLGQRHLTVGRVLAVLMVWGAYFAFWLFLGVAVLALDRTLKTLLLLVFMWIPIAVLLATFIVCAILEGIGVAKRIAAGDTLHSRYAGDSRFYSERFFSRLGQYRFQRYIEPVGVLLAAAAFAPISGPASNFLFLNGVLLFARGYMQHSQLIGTVLDMRDQAIEAKGLEEARRRMAQPGRSLATGMEIPPFVVHAGVPTSSPPEDSASPSPAEWLASPGSAVRATSPEE